MEGKHWWTQMGRRVPSRRLSARLRSSAATPPARLLIRGIRTGLGDHALVARAAPFAGTVRERRDERPVDQEVDQVQCCPYFGFGPAPKRIQRIARVGDGVDTSHLERLNQRQQACRLV